MSERQDIALLEEMRRIADLQDTVLEQRDGQLDKTNVLDYFGLQEQMIANLFVPSYQCCRSRGNF